MGLTKAVVQGGVCIFLRWWKSLSIAC